MYKPSRYAKVVLDKAQVAEIKEFYDGSYASVRELAIRFKVGTYRIRYIVNHKGYKEKIIEATKKWQKENPVRWKKARNENLKRYYLRHREEYKAKDKKYYKAHREELCAKARANYHKLKAK